MEKGKETIYHYAAVDGNNKVIAAVDTHIEDNYPDLRNLLEGLSGMDGRYYRLTSRPDKGEGLSTEGEPYGWANRAEEAAA